MKPTLIIADPLPGRRGRIVKWLEDEFDILAEANDGADVVELAAQLNPQLVVMGVAMPKFSGVRATKWITQGINPAPKVVLVSGVTNLETVRDAFEAGASDYVFKPISEQTLKDALRSLITEPTVE